VTRKHLTYTVIVTSLGCRPCDFKPFRSMRIVYECRSKTHDEARTWMSHVVGNWPLPGRV